MVTNVPKYLSPKTINHSIAYNRKKKKGKNVFVSS